MSTKKRTAKKASKRTRAKRSAPRGEPKKELLKERPFRTKVEDFVRTYKATGDLSEAVAKSGLSRGRAVELIQIHPELREDVSSVLADCGVTPQFIVRQYMRLASSDPRRAFDEKGNLKTVPEMDDDLAAAITEVTSSAREYERKDGRSETETTTKIRLVGKETALRELSKLSQLVEEPTLRVGNAPGEKFELNNGTPQETRADVIASLLSMIVPKPDPT